MGAFHNINEVACGLFGIERGDKDQLAVTDRCGQKLFRRTAAGLGLAPIRHMTTSTPNVVWGVKILGMVEGTDIEASDTLMFPFDGHSFWLACERVSDELVSAKAEWDAQGEELTPANP